MSDPHKRRWYQFSLRALLVVITVATVAFGGWVQYRRVRAQENRDRFATAEKLTREAIQEFDRRFEGDVLRFISYQQRPYTWLEKLFDDPGGPDDPVHVFYDISDLKIIERPSHTY